MTEVSVLRAGRDHKGVETNAMILRNHLAAIEVDAGNVGQNYADICVPTHDFADRRSDVGGRQRCRRYLIEQGLEQMIVVTVDKRDGKIIVCQRYRRRQPAEAGADNDDPSAVCASFV